MDSKTETKKNGCAHPPNKRVQREHGTYCMACGRIIDPVVRK